MIFSLSSLLFLSSQIIITNSINCFTSFARNDFKKTAPQALICQNKNFKKDLLISVPHPFFEKHTLIEGIDLFVKSKARFLIISKRYRCSNINQLTSCDGKTRVCGKKSSYPISDFTHNDKNIFFFLHKLLYQKFKLQILQFHETKRQDIDFIVTAGSKEKKTANFLSNKFAAYLQDNFKYRAVSCQNNFKRLCATTNTIGRFVNGSPSPCKISVQSAKKIRGDFLHIEQSYHLFLNPRNSIISDMQKAIEKNL